MKPLSVAMLAHIQQQATSLCTCWKITRLDGVIKGFTDHDQMVTLSSQDYLPAVGGERSANKTNSNLAVDNLDIEGVIDSDELSDIDLRNGLYDYAAVEVFLMNYDDPSMGRILLRRGWLGEVSLNEGGFRAEIRGLAQKLTTKFLKIYSPDCQAQLGDSKCQVTLATYQISGTVATVTEDRRRVLANVTAGSQVEVDFFADGVLTWATGDNTGLAIEIRSHSIIGAQADLTFYLPVSSVIQVGDTFTATPGCDKTYTTCQGKFNNILNFRGFNFVPGQDAALRVPNAT